jgi:hypothetical protein
VLADLSDGVGEAATPLDVFVHLICPCCCGAVSDVMVEHGGFDQEMSNSCNLWLWRCWRAVEDGDPEAWKVIVDGEFSVISLLRQREATNLGPGKHWEDPRSTCHIDMCLAVHGRPGLWRDLSTTSMGGHESRTGKALGRSLIDMPQRYVSCCAWQAWSLAQIALMATVLPRF